MIIKMKNKLFNLFINNEIVIFLSFMFLMKPAIVTTSISNYYFYM